MITKKVDVDDRGRVSATFYGKEKDVIANGDGTYSIPGAVDPVNADPFYTMDKPTVYMYDEEDRVWWKQ